MKLFVRHFRTTVAALTALGLVACGNGLGPVVSGRSASPGVAETTLSNGLVHRVSLPLFLESGSDISIRSVLLNTSTEPMVVEQRECGVDFSGTLKLSWPPGVLKCMAYSGRQELAAGDSIVGGDYMRVASGSGLYELRVRHALNPEIWTPITVRVR